MDAKEFYRLCNNIMQGSLAPVSAFDDVAADAVIEDDLDVDIDFSHATSAPDAVSELFTAGMSLPAHSDHAMQSTKKNCFSAGIQNINIPVGKRVSFADRYLPFSTDNTVPIIAIQILDWLYQVGYKLQHGDNFKQVIINSCSEIFGDGLTYEQCVASYASMRFGLYMLPADFVQLESSWSNDLFSVISNPHRVVPLAEAIAIAEAMREGYLKPSCLQRFALTSSISNGMLQCMKSGKQLDDAEAYCTSENAMLGYLKLLLADRYNKNEYQQSVQFGTIIQYVNEVLSGNVDELTILMCRRNDWSDLKGLLKETNLDAGIIKKYCNTPYLQQILKTSCSDESIIDRFFSEQNAIGDRYISELSGIMSVWSAGEFEWRALLQQDCARWNISTEKLFVFGEPLANLLVTAISTASIRDSEYRYLLYWLSKGVDGFAKVLLESANAVGVLGANEIAFIVVLEQLYNKLAQIGVSFDLAGFEKTKGIGCALVTQTKDKVQLYTVFELVEALDLVVEQFKDCTCVKLRKLDFQAGFVLQESAEQPLVIPKFQRMFSSEENWAASGDPIDTAGAYNLTKLNEKIQSAGYDRFPADFILPNGADLILDSISKSPELYGICAVKDLAASLAHLKEDILSGLSNSEIWYRQLLFIVVSGDVKYRQKNITKETLQFFLPMTEVRIRCGVVRKMTAANALSALPSLVDFVKSRQLNLEIARSSKSDLVIQVS